jgi:hypothetical protein
VIEMANKTQTVNLHKSYSGVNSALAKAFDVNGVKRSFAVPYVDGQATEEHVQAVGSAAAQSGGLAKNIVTSAHTEGGKGYGFGDGETVGHPTHDLMDTIVRKDDKDVKAALDATQTHLNNLKKLLGKNAPTVQTAQTQLNLIKERDGAGMTMYDLGVGLLNLITPPMQALSRAHSAANHGGPALGDEEVNAMNEPQEEEQEQASNQGDQGWTTQQPQEREQQPGQEQPGQEQPAPQEGQANGNA